MIGLSRAPLVAAVAFMAFAGCSQQQPSPLLTPAEDVRAPDTFRVQFETGKGRFVVEAHRAWAPLGADRFYTLVTNRFYDGNKFFRVLPGFVAQFGMHGDPDVTEVWEPRTLADDSVTQSNQEAFVTFATGGPNTRTTQIFINTRDNRRLDAMGFAPFGRVVSGMNVVHQLYGGYGEGPPGGGGPSQDRIRDEGNRYLNRFHPRLDSIIRARVVRD
jgi:peptidyl-prolyl cis-trans isomerase A (cyclophilin A)